MNTYFSEKDLLAPPTERAAFSDRQAYVCAELSKLAYFKFEGGHTLSDALAIVKSVFGDDKRLALVEQQLSTVLTSAPSSASEAKSALEQILKGADFELVDVINRQGTQGFFCTKRIKLESGVEKVLAFLVYRGTEPKNFEDIKTDARAALTPVEVGNEVLLLHSGYHSAFLLVKNDVEGLLEKTTYDQLFLTGHSLGGALAQVTTRILASSVNGACYTFGAPPIGTMEVQNNLKTPVYEIINEIDIVPRLPNPWMAGAFLVLLRMLKLLAKSVTVINRVLLSGTWDEKLERFMDAMIKYRHPGYVSYLVGSGQEARLRFNVSGFDRFKWFFAMTWKRRIWQFKKMVSDHSIDVYADKLRVHALKRQ
jgi:hypothetical protein